MGLRNYLFSRGVSGLFSLGFLIAIFVIGERSGAKGLVVLMNILAALLLIFFICFVIKFFVAFLKK